MAEKDFEEIIREELYREAEEIREEIDASDIEDLSEDKKAEIAEKIKKRLAAGDTGFSKESAGERPDKLSAEKPAGDVYVHLSEEDREALRLGRKLQGGRRKTKKMYLLLAAALVLVLALGMTSMGGAERIAQVVRETIGGRKVIKVSSDEKRIITKNQEESKAYQEIEDTFGVSVVKITYKLKDMKFVRVDIDKNLQTAEMLYQYKDKNLIYIINAGYMRSSLGVSLDDEFVESEEIEIKDNIIKVNVYRQKSNENITCSANFKYHGLEYFLMGAIEKDNFNNILKNLFFF